MKYEPPARTIRHWLRLNLGPGCLGVLTGEDGAALEAAISIVAAYFRASDQASRHGLLIGFGAAVRMMQPPARHLAYHSIAHVREWSDRAWFWAAACCDPVQVGRCAHEPTQVLAASLAALQRQADHAGDVAEDEDRFHDDGVPKSAPSHN